MAALGLASLPMQQPSFLQAATAGQQQQQQQQQAAQLLQQAIAPTAPPQPTPLDATAITIKLATLAGERFKVRAHSRSHPQRRRTRTRPHPSLFPRRSLILSTCVDLCC